MVAPWYGGITITIAAPMSCARRQRSAHTPVPKCVVVTITRHATGHMFEYGSRQHLALVVGEHKLLGEIGENAKAVGTGVDHEVDATLLARKIELTAVGEGGRYDRKDALVGSVHSMMSNWSRYSVFSVRPRPGLLSSSCRKPRSATGSPSKM